MLSIQQILLRLHVGSQMSYISPQDRSQFSIYTKSAQTRNCLVIQKFYKCTHCNGGFHVHLTSSKSCQQCNMTYCWHISQYIFLALGILQFPVYSEAFCNLSEVLYSAYDLWFKCEYARGWNVFASCTNLLVVFHRAFKYNVEFTHVEFNLL